jgi:FtsZ-interacting cell division protein ZipA
VGWIIVIAIIALAAVVGWVLWSRSRKGSAPASQPATERTSRVQDPTPMTGLEVALDQVTDRSGRNMREKIETGTAIDDLIVPEDTGPILRRALDNVEQTEPAAAVPEPAPGAAPADSANGETTPSDG